MNIEEKIRLYKDASVQLIHLFFVIFRQNIFYEMPVIRLMAVPEDELESDENLGGGLSKFSCPWFQNSERSGDDNYIQDLELPTEVDPDTWILRGVALLCQEPLLEGDKK